MNGEFNHQCHAYLGTLSIRCASGHSCLFSATKKKEKLTQTRTRQVTQKMSAVQRRMAKAAGLSNNVVFHTSKRGRTTMILNFPSIFGHDLMKILLSSFLNFTIDKSVFNFTPVKCVQAILHIGCTPFLELYIQNMKEIGMPRGLLVQCLGLIVEQYGFSYKSPMMDILFDMLNQRGISKDFLKSHLKHDNNLNLPQLMDNINILPPELQPEGKP